MRLRHFYASAQLKKVTSIGANSEIAGAPKSVALLLYRIWPGVMPSSREKKYVFAASLPREASGGDVCAGIGQTFAGSKFGHRFL